jgi:transposase
MDRRVERVVEKLWPKVEPLLPQHEASPKGGRPRASDRDCLAGIVWVLVTGARWRDVPAGLPSGPTCWRRLCEWTRAGVWDGVWRTVRAEWNRRRRPDEVAIDATFVPARRGASGSGTPSSARA